MMKLVGTAALLALAALVVSNLPDVQRYLKMRRM